MVKIFEKAVKVRKLIKIGIWAWIIPIIPYALYFNGFSSDFSYKLLLIGPSIGLNAFLPRGSGTIQVQNIHFFSWSILIGLIIVVMGIYSWAKYSRKGAIIFLFLSLISNLVGIARFIWDVY